MRQKKKKTNPHDLQNRKTESESPTITRALDNEHKSPTEDLTIFLHRTIHFSTFSISDSTISNSGQSKELDMPCS